MLNTKVKILVESFGTLRHFSNDLKKKENSSKSPFIPRDKCDELVQLLSDIQKVINANKAILTQRKIEKSKFDFDRAEKLLEKLRESLRSVSNYTKKASVDPKAKINTKPVSEKNISDTALVKSEH